MSDIFDGKNALIFGGANGIGRAIALEFAGRGANVSVADLDGEAALKSATDVSAKGVRGHSCKADVTDDKSVADAIDAARSELGSIDILINNVGAIVMGRPEDIPIAEWQRLIDINLMGAIRAMVPLLPEMLERGSGHIVNTATFAGLYPFATVRLPYVAAKAGLIMMTEALAIHCEPKGVRVSAFCPGPVATGIMDKMKTFGEDVEFRGPGSEYDLLTSAQAARALADGMAAGRIVIPSDDSVAPTVAAHGADPDAFIRDRIAIFASGDVGQPKISAELQQVLMDMQRG